MLGTAEADMDGRRGEKKGKAREEWKMVEADAAVPDYVGGASFLSDVDTLEARGRSNSKRYTQQLKAEKRRETSIPAQSVSAPYRQRASEDFGPSPDCFAEVRILAMFMADSGAPCMQPTWTKGDYRSNCTRGESCLAARGLFAHSVEARDLGF